MDIVRIIKQLLIDLYVMHSFGNDGEMVMIDELDCYIYKGKKNHYDQSLIVYGSYEGTIAINGFEDDDSIIRQSYVKMKEKDEVHFDKISTNSEELQFLNNVIKKIRGILNPNDVAKNMIRGEKYERS